MTAEADAQAEALLAEWDRLADQWINATAKEGLETVFQVSERIAGNRLDGPGGSELRMLLLRQRALIKRWMKEAFAEGAAAEWARHPLPGERSYDAATLAMARDLYEFGLRSGTMNRSQAVSKIQVYLNNVLTKGALSSIAVPTFGGVD